MTARKSYHHGDLRRTLLRAATDVVRTRGLPELSLRAVAREAKVSHAAPYHHFADRAALLAAVAEEGFVGLKRSMERQLRGLSGPKDKLEASGVGYVMFAVRNPMHFRVMFSAEFEDKSKFPQLDAASKAAHEVLTRLAAECQWLSGSSTYKETSWSRSPLPFCCARPLHKPPPRSKP